METPDFVSNEEYLTSEYIKYANQFQNDHPNDILRITIKNTKGLSSDVLRLLDPKIQVKVTGGYSYSSEETGGYYDDFIEKTVYSRNELVRIVQAMEKIEKGIHDSWGDIQKVVYVYQQIKGTINYDPNFEHEDSLNIRTLRGLVSKKTVCAGYSLIFKEIMDRQGVKCSYVGGQVPHKDGTYGGHAWNIIEIQGKKFPIDLTWDAGNHRIGFFGSVLYLGQNTEEFIKTHIPNPWEPIQNYERELSSIDRRFLANLTKKVSNEMDYNNTTFNFKRKDGSRYTLSQVGYVRHPQSGEIIYKYVYMTENKHVKSAPIILFSQTNVANFIDMKLFGDKIIEGYEDSLVNIVFSTENINDSFKNKSYYIGGVLNEVDSKSYVVKSLGEIKKPDSYIKFFSSKETPFFRQDGTMFTVQQRTTDPQNFNGKNLFCYEIYENIPTDDINQKNVIRRNVIWTEKDLLHVTNMRSFIANDFLSRERLDRKTYETGGYLGTFNDQGEKTSDPELVESFEFLKPINVEYVKEQPLRMIPTFEELHQTFLKYKTVKEPDPTNKRPYIIRYADVNTGKIVTDIETIENIMFANLWHTSAGLIWMQDEKIKGEHYAFEISPAYQLYTFMCNEFNKDIKEKGVIDTVKLLKNVDCLCYKHSEEILVGMLRNPNFVNFINRYFRSAVSKSELLPYKEPVALTDSTLAKTFNPDKNNNTNPNSENEQNKLKQDLTEMER